MVNCPAEVGELIRVFHQVVRIGFVYDLRQRRSHFFVSLKSRLYPVQQLLAVAAEHVFQLYISVDDRFSVGKGEPTRHVFDYLRNHLRGQSLVQL